MMFKKRKEIQKLKLINAHLSDVVADQNASYEVLSDEYKKLANKYFKCNDEIEELKVEILDAKRTIESLKETIANKDNKYSKLYDDYKAAEADKMAVQLNNVLLLDEINTLKSEDDTESNHN